MSSRVSRSSASGEAEAKWDSPARATRGSSGAAKDEAKSSLSRPSRDQLASKLQQAKEKIEDVEAELEDGGEEDDEEGSSASLRARGSQLKRDAEGKAADLKVRGTAMARDAQAKGTQLARDAQAKGSALARDAQNKGSRLARDLQDKGEELVDDAEEALEDVAAKAPRLSSRLSRGASDARESARKGVNDAKDSARQTLSDAKQTLKQKKGQLQSKLQRDDDEEDDGEQDEDEEEGSSSNWQSTLLNKGNELLHVAADATANLRHRIADAAPGIKDTLEKGVRGGLKTAQQTVRSAQQKLASVDLEDGESEGSASDSEEDEEQDEESEGEEGQVSNKLRGAAARVQSKGKQLASDLRNTDLGSQARQTLNRGRQALDDALHSDVGAKAQAVLGRAKAGARSALDQARSRGADLKDRASKTASEFDLDEAQEDLQDRADEAVETVRGRAADLKNRANSGLRQAKETLDANLPRDARARLEETGSSLRSGAEKLTSRARSGLRQAEDSLNDLAPSDRAFNRTVQRGLNKFDRIVEKDNNMNIPMMIIGTIFALWLGASICQNVIGVPEPTPTPTGLLDSARLAAHDLKHLGLDQLQHLAENLHLRERPMTWSEKIGTWITGASHTASPIDAAHIRDAIRNARESAEETAGAIRDAVTGEIIPGVRRGVDEARGYRDAAKAYAKDTLIPGARDAAQRAQEVGEEAKYHYNHAGEYVQVARESAENVRNLAEQKAEDLNLIQKRSLLGRAWGWLTGAPSETYPEQAARKARELKDRVAASMEQVKANMPSAHRSLGERILDSVKAHLPGHRETVLEKVQRNIPNLDPKGTAQDYYARALAAGYELQDGVYKLTHRSLADRIKSHLPWHHDSFLDKVARNVPNLDPRGTANDYYARAVEAGYELKDGAYQLTHRSLVDRIKAHLPGHHDTILDKIERNLPNIDPKGTAEEYYARALGAGYELKDGVYQLTHRSLADRIRAHLPGHHDTLLERAQRNIPNLDPKGTAQDYYARALAAGYELQDGVYKLTHRSLADRIKSHLPGHRSMLDRVERNIPNLDVSGTAQEYYDRAVAAGYELQDGAYRLTHRSLADRIKSHLPGHRESVLDKVQRNIPNLDVKGTAEDYFARALAAGYEIKDGAYQLTHRSLADRIRSHLPGHHDSVLERVQRNIPGLDVKGTAEEYYARALEAGYELKDGAWKLTHPHRSLADRIRAHLPGHDATLLERAQRNIPNIDPKLTAQDYYAKALAAGYELKDGVWQLTHPQRTLADRIKAHLPGHRDTVLERVQRNLPNIDPKGTAEEYYARALEAGYELKDGVYQLTHRSLADRIRAHLPGHHDTVYEQAQRNIPNLDVSGSAKDYLERARAAGYELRNGAYQLADRVGDAAHHARQYTDGLAAQDHAATHPDPIRGGIPQPHDAVPLSGVRDDIAHAQPQPDALGHASPMHVPADLNTHPTHTTDPAALNAHRQTLAQQVKGAVRQGVESIKSHLPGGHAAQVLPDDGSLHHLRKEAEYAEHRTVHKAEELAHRAEEAAKYAKDRAERAL